MALNVIGVGYGRGRFKYRLVLEAIVKEELIEGSEVKGLVELAI